MQVIMLNEITQGGVAGHVARRLIHLSILVTPFLYYFFLLPQFSVLFAHGVLIVIITGVLAFEFIRIRFGFVLFGQRYYEEDRVSAFAWTISSLCVLFLFSPSIALSLPIVTACALVDPLMGEMRLRRLPASLTLGLGFFLVLFIWLLSVTHLGIPWWFAWFAATVTILVEYPSFQWIDDNALMLLVPLLLGLWLL